MWKTDPKGLHFTCGESESQSGQAQATAKSPGGPAPMIDIESLLPKMDAFLATMYAVQDGFGFHYPKTKHIGTCINYIDLQEMRSQFVEELTNTIVTYVYSPTKQKQLRLQLSAEGRDEGAAWRQLLRRARKKFRPSNVQGQFSELLLCNLLQHYYRAAPLVRKMPITTNPELERNGADAIHIARNGTGYRLYIGEAKTYNRKNGSFSAALSDAVKDVLKKCSTHVDELDLYTYEDFVPAELEEVARQYRAGKLPDAEVHLVCIVTYDEKTKVNGKTKQQMLDSTIDALRVQAKAAFESKAIKDVPAQYLPRLNFIMFPVQAMNDLIEAFKREVG